MSYEPHRPLYQRISDSTSKAYNRRQNDSHINEQVEEHLDELKTNLAVIAASLNLGFDDVVKLHLTEVMKNDRLVGQLGVARVAQAMKVHFASVSTSDADYKSMVADCKEWERERESVLIKQLSNIVGEINKAKTKRK